MRASLRGEVIAKDDPADWGEKLGLDFGPSDSKASVLVTFSLYLKFIHSANTFWIFPMFREEFRMLNETLAMKRKESSNIFRAVCMIDATLYVHPHDHR